jgi:hypothetical protein
MEGPVRVAEHFPGEEDEICLSGAEDVVGLLGAGDHADGSGEEAGFATDALGEMGLVSGADGDLGGGEVSTAGDIEEIDAVGFEEAGKFDGLLEGPFLVGVVGGSPVCGGDADEEGQMGGPNGADFASDFEEEAGAVLEAAAVLVCAVIAEGRKELVQ